MGCNCKWTEIVFGVVIFVLAVWPQLFGAMVSKWVVGIAAVLLVFHALTCKNCGACGPNMKPAKKR